MPITLNWGDFDETFLVWNFTQNWTTEEFYDLLQELQRYAQPKKQPIKIMVDMRRSMKAPNNLLTLLRIAVKSNIQNIEKIVVISNSNFWIQMYQILVKTTHLDDNTPVTFVNSVDEAYYLIGGFAMSD